MTEATKATLARGARLEHRITPFREDGSPKSIDEVVLELTEIHLKFHGGNKTAAASTLGIRRPALYRKIAAIERRNATKAHIG